MPRSKDVTKFRDVLTSLLLALAISLAWPAMGSPHEPPAQTGQHHPAAADAQGEHHEGAAACSPDPGCCVMTHCHPGVAQPLLEMPHALPLPRHQPSAPAKEAGVEPPILLPPPRALLV